MNRERLKMVRDRIAAKPPELLNMSGTVEFPAKANATLACAAPELYEALKGLMPTNVCLTNPNIGDDVIVPCDVTMGELRRCAAARARAEGRSV